VGFTLRCGDIAGKCDFVVHCETEEEIFLKIGEHIKTSHGLIVNSKIINDEIRKSIREENLA
jgi:predicted small metal-binding protein